MILTLASTDNPLFSQASMSAAAAASSRRVSLNHRIVRRRTRSVSAARSASADVRLAIKDSVSDRADDQAMTNRLKGGADLVGKLPLAFPQQRPHRRQMRNHFPV